METKTARRVAGWYGAAKHSPDDDATREAYGSLTRETMAQFAGILETGFTFEFTDCDPYANSAELFDDYGKGRMRVFLTDVSELPVDHPMAAESGYDGLTVNDLFRAVHDYYGHCQERNGFGPRGEDRAYLFHATMFTRSALPALTTETRGQNSWFNYGPYSGLPAPVRPFAEQKAIAAPGWVVAGNFPKFV